MPPNILPALIPWLALIGLLALRFNRRGAAWLIAVPALFAFGLARVMSALNTETIGLPLDQVGEAYHSLAFAIAAIWLISPWLVSLHRVATFFKMWLAVIVFDVLLLVAQGILDFAGPEVFVFAILSGLAGSILVISLVMAGLVSRRGYRPVRFLLWLMVFSLGLSISLPAPFYILAVISGGTSGSIFEFIWPVLALEVLCVSPVLPLLLLSFANGFYRERFIALFNLGRGELPPVIAPVPGTGLAPGFKSA